MHDGSIEGSETSNDVPDSCAPQGGLLVPSGGLLVPSLLDALNFYITGTLMTPPIQKRLQYMGQKNYQSHFEAYLE